jgi:hypothetical protein
MTGKRLLANFGALEKRIPGNDSADREGYCLKCAEHLFFYRDVFLQVTTRKETKLTAA